MSGHYVCKPHIWLALAVADFEVALTLFVLRRRSVPGALRLAVTLLTGVPVSLGSAFRVMAVDAPTKIFWLKFKAP